jgi:hypothetical protein
MKRLVATCPDSNTIIIVPVSDSVTLPAAGRVLSLQCPACHAQHEMATRDPEQRGHPS